jgi:hypothetical protein
VTRRSPVVTSVSNDGHKDGAWITLGTMWLLRAQMGVNGNLARHMLSPVKQVHARFPHTVINVRSGEH